MTRHTDTSTKASSPILPLEAALMRRRLICIQWCLTRIVWALPVIPLPRGAVGACIPAWYLFCWVIRPPQRSPARCAMIHELRAHFTMAHPANVTALSCYDCMCSITGPQSENSFMISPHQTLFMLPRYQIRSMVACAGPLTAQHFSSRL